MAESVGIALVGCGRIAHKHVDAAAHMAPQAQLMAVCDIVEERAQEKGREYGTKLAELGQSLPNPEVVLDYKELLGREDIQMTAIATESGNHAQIAIDFLEAGKHVLVEKPMALSMQDADRMIALAKKKGLCLGVTHQNRFNKTIQALRKAVEAGRFGRILAGNARILWNRNQEYYTQAPWRGTYAQDGGCLMNQCIHNIDLLQWMLGGQMRQVQAMLGNFLHPYIEAEDYGTIQVRFANGVIGNVEGTVCVYPKNLEETLTILGEKGTVVIGGTALNEIKTWQFADGLDMLEDVRSQCDSQIDSVYGWGHRPLYADFLSSLQEGRLPLIHGEEGKKAMAIILHAYHANQKGNRLSYGETALAMPEFPQGEWQKQP